MADVLLLLVPYSSKSCLAIDMELNLRYHERYNRPNENVFQPFSGLYSCYVITGAMLKGS